MINVFIGTEPKQRIPTEILKHSIRKRTKAEVTFHNLCDLNCGLENKFYTGFSFYRWSIPQAMKGQGRAIYLDADIVCVSDIEELYNMDMRGATHLCRRYPHGGAYASVMLVDCEKADWDFDKWVKRAVRDKMFYKGIMWCKSGYPTAKGLGFLPSYFNSMDHKQKFDHGPKEAKFYHYTIVPTQPWANKGHKDQYIFYRELREALDEGAINGQLLLDEIEKKHCHDGLEEVLKHVTNRER